MSGHRPKAGEMLRQATALDREAAVHRGDVVHAVTNAQHRQKAKEIKDRIGAPIEHEDLSKVGAGGELAPHDGPFKELGTPMEPTPLPARLLRDTVQDPNLVTIDASRHRLELAADAGALELGLDLADTVEADNSLEKMLTHQLAANHRSAMKLSALLNRNLESLQSTSTAQMAAAPMQMVNAETCRLANSLSRIQAAFQEGVLTLQKLRTKGRQQMVIQHVHVNEGGQAVVAGQLKGSRKRKACRSRSKNGC